METLMDLLEEELKDLYNAENQLLKAMPRVIRKTSSGALKAQLETHVEETKGQVRRLEKAAESLEITLKGKVCHAMKGLLEEATEALGEAEEGAVLDAALIGAVQRVEHYEIAGYGVARSLAQTLGHDDVVKLLQETLDEEGAADKKLTEIAEGEIYVTAHKGEASDADESEGEESDEETEGSEEETATQDKSRGAAAGGRGVKSTGRAPAERNGNGSSKKDPDAKGSRSAGAVRKR